MRYHNIYGPQGTFDGGREKAPAALCRKIILAKKNNLKQIDVWGDGEQTRSFLYIDDCIKGTLDVFNSGFSDVFNVGSEEQVSINQLVNFIEDISQYKVKKKYLLDKPKGVRGRTSDNQFIREKIGWDTKINLKDGLKKTYEWIYNEITSGSNTKRFTRS